MPLRLPPTIPLRCPTTALLVLASTLACAVRGAGVPDDTPAWLRADPQRCLLPRDLGENMEAMARRCAELFVAENGYTDQPATVDSTRWVMEDGEQGPWLRVLAGRVGMLERSATGVQCSFRQCVVFFRARRLPQACVYRAVTMTQVYTRIQLAPVEVHELHCAERMA
ncbi:MAG TPA: hypothetical protein VJQ44_09910 [Gemmatimonadales bacterium]|nr:hypothetical protein [Gemmatimonadales bacterium]